jgi:heme/copper-type cytochrome/quinol oxidase subunit 1
MLITAFVFFALGGVEALLMRLELARPDNHFIGPDLYDQLFTVHGSTMMFLFAVPVMQAMGIYLVPLMIGTRSVAFPRLNAYAYYTYLIGGIFLYVSLFTDTGPDTGWFSYLPLSGPQFAPGKRVDVWSQLVTFTELSALSTAANLIVTTLKFRAPGMALNRMPLFVWAELVTSFMVIFAMPAVMLASMCLALDRLVGTHFFNSAVGGDPWHGDTLEWSVASPPAPHAYTYLPCVASRYPLWEGLGDCAVEDMDPRQRQVLVTAALDAAPDHVYMLPGPSIWPFLAAAATGVTFITMIFTPWAVPLGLALGTICLVGWFWPRPPLEPLLAEQP